MSIHARINLSSICTTAATIFQRCGITSRRRKSPLIFSFDTTLGYEDCGFKSTHMGAPEVIRLKEELEALGIVDKHTHCVMNHFSHNGHLLYDELVKLAAPHDIEISYDGMKLTL